jgi:hypothetical protein
MSGNGVDKLYPVGGPRLAACLGGFWVLAPFPGKHAIEAPARHHAEELATQPFAREAETQQPGAPIHKAGPADKLRLVAEPP